MIFLTHKIRQQACNLPGLLHVLLQVPHSQVLKQSESGDETTLQPKQTFVVLVKYLVIVRINTWVNFTSTYNHCNYHGNTAARTNEYVAVPDRN